MGVKFTYKVQEEADGIAQALGLAENFANRDNVVVILGDNEFSDSIVPYVRVFAEQDKGAKILLQEVQDPQRYDVPELDTDRIVSIEEKPRVPKSNYAVTGIYMFDARVYDIIKKIHPSERNELEITNVNNSYIKLGELGNEILNAWWTDAGTHATLAKANELAQSLQLGEEFGKLKF